MGGGAGEAGGVDVCVVGAGTAGLTLAVGLRRLGLRVRIVDKAPTAGREARPLVLWARARAALDALGVGGLLRCHGVGPDAVTIHARDRFLGELTTGWALSAHARPLTVAQHDVERLLREELARLGTRVEWNAEVTGVEVDEDRAEFTVRHGDGRVESAAAAWIVGCEGASSVVRDGLGIPFEGRRTGLQVVQGDARPARPFGEGPARGHLLLAPHRSLLVFPLPGGGFRFFCFRDAPDPTPAAAATTPTTPTTPELRDLVADTLRIPGLRLDATEPLRPDHDHLGHRLAARFRHGRALLAGDAAHAWAPVGGHGVNVGILGAHNLAWKLAAVHRGHAGEGLLDTYGDEQRRTAVRYVRAMRFDFMEPPLPPLGHRAFTAAVPGTLARRHGFRHRLDRRRDHRGGALSWHLAAPYHRTGPRAGDRMPDVRVVAGGPVARRMHTLLAYERWTLVLHAARAEPAVVDALRQECARFAAPVRILPVTPGDAFEAGRLGHPGDLCLVRPDGYVGLVAPLARPALLRAYLAALGPAVPGTSRHPGELYPPRVYRGGVP
ncbi:FAD-dependent monooxygenase [Streptomyces sp. E-08]|uniref:FAD-dependent monooxygenase n=1 Tax=Streptomyces sp. E-08 TaxID=3404047 RepID=UPI003CEF392D